MSKAVNILSHLLVNEKAIGFTWGDHTQGPKFSGHSPPSPLQCPPLQPRTTLETCFLGPHDSVRSRPGVNTARPSQRFPLSAVRGEPLPGRSGHSHPFRVTALGPVNAGTEVHGPGTQQRCLRLECTWLRVVGTVERAPW